VIAMREQIEELRAAEQGSVHAATATCVEEVMQLRATAQALREELEQREIRHREELQALDRASRDEMTQLQRTIGELRDRLEACSAAARA
jgi:regulator of replication initiation timing